MQNVRNENLKVAIHQPNYFPWLGFFYKIFASDVFVFHDNVEHSKRYPTRRTRIRKASGSDESCWLTVPLKKHSDFTLIKDLEIDHSQDWQGKHLRKISHSYSGAPFFPDVFPKIENWLTESKQFDLLGDLNVFLVGKILEWMGIERESYRSSELPVVGEGSAYNVALVKHFGGRVYLSGKGGRNYQDEKDFSKEGIELTITDFKKCFSLLPTEKPFISNSLIESMFYFNPNQLTTTLNKIKSVHAQGSVTR